MKVSFIVILILHCILFSSASSAESAQILAPGYQKLSFQAPVAGTYALPVIRAAGDGKVISSTGKPLTLHQLMGDKIVLLSFIYSTCSDINGCPLASAVFHRIKKKLSQQTELARHIRLLTLSFNPQFDTPEQMRIYSQGFADPNIDWQFLTTVSESELQPILDNYQQNIQKNYDEKGQFNGTFSHLLRVYLIDKNKKVRNIYSVDFLHAETLLNDIQTLLSPINTDNLQEKNKQQNIFQAGDNKTNYQRQDYQTDSIALTQRLGQSANLIESIKNPPLGLPVMKIPEDNPVTELKIQLGRKLFYDRRLSLNNTFSCAICHIPEQGFSSNEMQTPVGIEGRSVRRNTPTLYNVGYFEKLFHDSRENTLEQQVWGPLLAANEMGNPSIGYVLDKIKNAQDYEQLFEQAFGRGPGMETVGMALASYQRTLNTANSAFDQWYYANKADAMSQQAQQGWLLFNGQAGCSNCHLVNEKHALFTDQLSHNTGIGYAESMRNTTQKQKIQLAPGIFAEVDRSIITAVTEAKANDLGLYEITQNPAHRWSYKTPSLRNISLTAPYMHNGSLATLEEVIEFYNQGGVANENQDKRIQVLNLTELQKQQLLAFLQSLNGDNINELISDAYSAPVGDVE